MHDGEIAVSASYDSTIRLWDVQSGECVNTLAISGPYDGMNIIGISEAQRSALMALGAVEE